MVTPADVRDELAFDGDALGVSETSFDDLLDSLIGRETARVEDAIDVVLGTETVTQDLSRPSHVDGHDLPLPSRPVQSVASVEIDIGRVGGATVTADDYIVHDTHLELLPSADRNRWPTKRRSVTVEWTHGYPDGEEPDPVAAGIVGLVRQALQEIEADGIQQEMMGGDSVSYETADDVVARHLARAKRFNEPDYYGGVGVV